MEVVPVKVVVTGFGQGSWFGCEMVIRKDSTASDEISLLWGLQGQKGPSAASLHQDLHVYKISNVLNECLCSR